MNKIIGQLVLALALVSLAGCGLKGPLYFPPQDQPTKTQPSSKTVPTDSDVSSRINSKPSMQAN